MTTPAIVPRGDNEGDIGTSSKRWADVYMAGDLTDGTDAVSASEAKDAYDHSVVTSGNPHSVTAAEASADPAGTAASEMATHESTYNHALIISADPAGTAASAVATHESTYDHTKIRDASKIQGRDVASTAPSDGQVLEWDSGNSQWQPGAGGSALTSVSTDATITGDGTAGDPLVVADNGHDHTLSNISDAGTAAEKDYPSVGDAAAGEVVIGTDSRLTDDRDPTTHATEHEAGGADVVDHDSLSGFVANEHVDHSGVTMTAGDGLSGGGTIASTRTFAVDPTALVQALCYDITDETTEITTGDAKKTFRMPYVFYLEDIKASLTTAPSFTSSSSSSSSSDAEKFTIDIRKNGVSIFTTKLTIDAGETTSATAFIPAVIGTSTLADDDEIKVDVDNALINATGLKISLIGTTDLI